MSIHWLKVFIAALFEVFWVVGLKHSSGLLGAIATGFFLITSFYLLISAGNKLPVGTVYAVFVGLGTAGTVLSEILFFSEPIDILKITFIALLLIGVIGLKFTTDEEKREGEQS